MDKKEYIDRFNEIFGDFGIIFNDYNLQKTANDIQNHKTNRKNDFVDNSDTDKSDTDKSNTDKSDTDKSDTDKSNTDKSDTDKSSTDKSDANDNESSQSADMSDIEEQTTPILQAGFVAPDGWEIDYEKSNFDMGDVRFKRQLQKFTSFEKDTEWCKLKDDLCNHYITSYNEGDNAVVLLNRLAMKSYLEKNANHFSFVNHNEVYRIIDMQCNDNKILKPYYFFAICRYDDMCIPNISNIKSTITYVESIDENHVLCKITFKDTPLSVIEANCYKILNDKNFMWFNTFDGAVKFIDMNKESLVLSGL